MKVPIYIFVLFALAESRMPEHRMESQVSFERFVCPPSIVLKPCECTTVPDIPTIFCGKIRSLKTIHTALKFWFQEVPIPNLKIVDARFDGLPSRAFVFVNVTRLQIKDSNLKWIATDAFAGLNSLLMLTLHNVALFSFPSESLVQLSSLVSLRLPENQMSELVHNHMKGVGKLKYLSLEGNTLSRVEHRSFPITLVTLSLAHNCLRGLNKSIRKLVNLEWLFLNDNRFMALEGELNGLHNLRQLNLAKNSIRHLGRSFRDLDNLQELYLQFNSIHRLGSSLHNLSQLKSLNLSMNRLVHLHARDFETLVLLERLDLSGNRLSVIEGAFRPLLNLRRLDLSNNRLRNFSHFQISSLRQLTLLDLSNNRLHRLNSSPVPVSLPIERIFFARNRLTSLGFFLRHFYQLEAVDVSFNDISIIKSSDFTMSDKMEYIGLLGNPLLCDDQQRYVFQTLENKNIEIDGLQVCESTLVSQEIKSLT